MGVELGSDLRFVTALRHVEQSTMVRGGLAVGLVVGQRHLLKSAEEGAAEIPRCAKGALPATS